MTGLKKSIWIASAFALGVGITFVVMSLMSAMEEYEKQRVGNEQNQQVLNEILELRKMEELKERTLNQDKHWIEERIEREGSATERRIREQESQGDALKNEFEKFAK